MIEAEGITLTEKAIEMGKQKVADVGEPVQRVALVAPEADLARDPFRDR